MTKLIVAVPVFGKIKGVAYEENATLNLETSAAITPDNAKTKYFGNWSSPSVYLGKDFRGKYYVQNVKLSPEERWMTDTIYEFNPFGFFFDSTSTEPFLVLNLFEPMSMDNPSRDGGGGRLLRVSHTIRESTLRWYVDSGKTLEELRKEALDKLNKK
jgi:hypothetical protein